MPVAPKGVPALAAPAPPAAKVEASADSTEAVVRTFFSENWKVMLAVAAIGAIAAGTLYIVRGSGSTGSAKKGDAEKKPANKEKTKKKDKTATSQTAAGTSSSSSTSASTSSSASTSAVAAEVQIPFFFFFFLSPFLFCPLTCVALRSSAVPPF